MENKKEINALVVKRYNELNETKCMTVMDVLDILSDEFADAYNRIGDAQQAFDTVMDENKALAEGIAFVYTLSGDASWYVTRGSGYVEAKKAEYVLLVNETYDEDAEDFGEALGVIEHRVRKDMSNAGCDASNALNMILEEDLGQDLDSPIFRIEGVDEDPRIEIWY